MTKTRYGYVVRPAWTDDGDPIVTSTYTTRSAAETARRQLLREHPYCISALILKIKLDQ